MVFSDMRIVEILTTSFFKLCKCTASQGLFVFTFEKTCSLQGLSSLNILYKQYIISVSGRLKNS